MNDDSPEARRRRFRVERNEELAGPNGGACRLYARGDDDRVVYLRPVLRLLQGGAR